MSEEFYVSKIFISDEFVAMFREKTGYPIIEPAHMVIDSLILSSCYGNVL